MVPSVPVVTLTTAAVRTPVESIAGFDSGRNCTSVAARGWPLAKRNLPVTVIVERGAWSVERGARSSLLPAPCFRSGSFGFAGWAAGKFDPLQRVMREALRHHETAFPVHIRICALG